MPSDPTPDWLLAERRRMGATIRRLRMGKSWSQERLGERAGIDRRTISTIELGTRGTTTDHVMRIAAALGVPTRKLFE